jgi:hypothetical protein
MASSRISFRLVGNPETEMSPSAAFEWLVIRPGSMSRAEITSYKPTYRYLTNPHISNV